MKRKVQVKNNMITVDGRKIPILSGEVHYWRLNPNYWKEILDRVREMGLKVISTYIPWHYHEYSRGKLDFTGKTDPGRDLQGFLELSRREGFWVIIRPGPYIYSEWPNDGVPAYVYKYHRLHPKFLEYASRYLEQVCKIIKPFLASRKNGHIFLLQADNEIDPWPDTFGHQYGLDGKPGLFQEYMSELYHGNLAELNDRWGTEYRSFKEVNAFIATMLQGENGLPLKGDKELQRNIDYFRFKYFYSRKVAEWVVAEYRRLGIDVPIYLNLYPFFYAHDWIEMQKSCDLIGLDLYPLAELSEDRHEHRKITDKIRYLSSVSKLPFIAEFASGVWHARHYETGVLTPNHYRLLVLSAILGGIVGWNWYMLVNRDNWYMSPINEWGRVRGELFKVFKDMVRIFEKMQPPTLTKMTNVAVTFIPIQHAARTLTHNSAIPVQLYEADVDYDVYDPRLAPCKQPILFYSGNQWLETAAHKNLRKYVEEGGMLVAFRDYPRKDERFRNCSMTGFQDPERILFEFKRRFSFRLDSSRPPLEVTSSVFSFGDVAGQKITADLGTYGKQTIGYIKKIGKGKILHLGIEPSRDVVIEILRYFKIKTACYSPTRDIKSALFRRGKSYYLVLVNNGDEDKSATVFLTALEPFKGPMKITDLDTGLSKVYSYERRTPFSVDICRKDGKVFEFKAKS